jgi:hypothetical protein
MILVGGLAGAVGPAALAAQADPQAPAAEARRGREGDFPNLPAGFTRISDVTWDAPDKLPPIGGGARGGQWVRRGGGRRITVGAAAEAGCPAGPFGPVVLRGFVPRGFNLVEGRPRGIGPWNMEMHFTDAVDRYNSVYQSIWTSTPPDFREGANFGHKWSWFMGAPNSRTNHFWAAFDEPRRGGQAPRPRFVTQFNGSWARRGQQWTAPPGRTLPHGRWHHIEMLLRGGTPGFRDGSFEMWVNGEKYLDVRGQGIQPPEARGRLQGFRGVKWNPTWGGEEAQPVDTHICVARWAVFVADAVQ